MMQIGPLTVSANRWLFPCVGFQIGGHGQDGVFIFLWRLVVWIQPYPCSSTLPWHLRWLRVCKYYGTNI